MASLVPSSVPQRFQRVLSVTAAAWGVPLPLPERKVVRVRTVRASRAPALRDCRRAAVAFTGFAISY